MDDKRRAALTASPQFDCTGRSIDRCISADPVIIPRLKGDSASSYEALGPGWSPVYHEVNGEKVWNKPIFRCKCGHWTGIALHHVHSDGHVTASFYDSEGTSFTHNGKTYNHEPGCGWHVFIKLADYIFGDFPPEA